MIAASLFILTSCESEDKFLEENPSDFLTTENAYLNKAQFELAIAGMHDQMQEFFNSSDGDVDTWMLGLGTDVCFWPMDDSRIYNDWTLVNEFHWYSGQWYDRQYKIINLANNVIDNAKNEEVKWNSDEEKNAIVAEARFFRAFAYRNLVNIFGGVPLVKESITSAKLDFVRATKEACNQFAKEDLEFASSHLPITASQPGRVVRAAADHLLSEINISLNDYDGAIAAASRVINGTDGNYKLMNARFGSRMNETDKGKDVYWDLFRMGNQNYDTGNTESIWTTQYEFNTPGGVPRYSRTLIERTMWPRHWLFAKAGYNGVAVDSTGRGVSFVRPTDYSNYTIWKNSGNDIRNKEINIKRKFYFADDVPPYSKGDVIPKSFLTAREDTLQYIYPAWAKFGTDKHLDNGRPGFYIRDFYVMRLSETYLLRAEAYLGKGELQKAADDINIVRARAQAPLIGAADVTLDYILDERARELFGEEFRQLTLGRLGLRVQRTQQYGYPPAALSITARNDLFPIPQTVIDRNTEAVIEQNPGY
ncbi:RagB/SusD family nutrient uptake outer membrane protein [Snuella lapsa]|uniref:RagB/SusD family nutrient uptake outer membrane protein n=2 Tax=Snuella lapsa TaxID=870481 RepID=A0ABP6WTI9_9FLAO